MTNDARIGEPCDATSPLQLGEIVLKTSHYKRMKDWYCALLALEPFNEHVPEGPVTAGAPVTMCFFRLHFDFPLQQMIALFEVAESGDASVGDSGLHHMQLRSATIRQLCARYRRLAAASIVPHRGMNHGPSTSFYYRDPDQNVVELSAPNVDTAKAMQALFETESYRQSPRGYELAPAELASRVLD